MNTLAPNATLEDAKAWLRPRIWEQDGENCPCCTQRAKVYKRPVYPKQLRSLLRLYDRAGRNFAHWPTILSENGNTQADETKLRYHGLVEEMDERASDGNRAGMWRVTELGERWLKGEVTIPKYVFVYNSVSLGTEGPEISFADGLREPNFDFQAHVRSAATAA